MLRRERLSDKFHLFCHKKIFTKSPDGDIILRGWYSEKKLYLFKIILKRNVTVKYQAVTTELVLLYANETSLSRHYRMEGCLWTLVLLAQGKSVSLLGNI